jgi:hypothetical protein
MNHPVLQQPTTFSIAHKIFSNNSHALLRDKEWYFPHIIVTGDLGDSRAPHHAFPYIALLLDNSSVPKSAQYFKRMLLPADLSPSEVTNYLRAIAAYRKRCMAAGGAHLQPSDAEVEAFMELFSKLVPKFHGHPLTFDNSDYKYKGRIDPEDQVIGINDIYSPETIARCLSKGAYLTNSPEEQDLIRDIDGLMTVLGNAEIQVLNQKLGGVSGRFPPLLVAKTLGSTFGVLGARSPIGHPMAINPNYTFLSRLMQAFGQAALDWGVEQANFDTTYCFQSLVIKNATSLTMKTLASMQGRLEGLPRFKDFELSRADLNSFSGYLRILGQFSEDYKKVPPQSQALRELLEDPDIQKMIKTYEARFGILKNGGWGACDTNLDIEPLLCQGPGHGKNAHKGLGAA